MRETCGCESGEGVPRAQCGDGGTGMHARFWKGGARGGWEGAAATDFETLITLKLGVIVPAKVMGGLRICLRGRSSLASIQAGKPPVDCWFLRGLSNGEITW